MLAIACVRTGRLDEADAIIATLPAEEVRSTSVQLTRGELALRRREPSIAATHFRAAIDESAADVRSEAATEAIVVYATNGCMTEAVELLDTVALPPPVAARGWMNVGIAHAKQGAFVEAVACFEKAAGFDPASGEIRQLLDRARAANAQPSEAPADVPQRSSGVRGVGQGLQS